MSRFGLRAFTTGFILACALAITSASGPSFRPTTTFKGSSLAGWHTVGDATWTAADGVITGTPAQPAGGWLVLDQAFQDVGVFASYRCSAGCQAGILIRADKAATGGMKGLAVPLDAPAGRGRANADPSAGFSGRARGPINLTTPLPPGVVTSPQYKPGDWNDVEVIADAAQVRALVNDGAVGLGPADPNAARFGSIALFVGGTGPVSFKNLGYRDLLLQSREAEKVGGRFRAQQLSDFYYSWGVGAADFNHDGVLDVVSGPHIFYGPAFTERREIYVQQAINPS